MSYCIIQCKFACALHCTDLVRRWRTQSSLNILCEIFSFAVRLVGGKNSREGRVEVYYRGQWGTICDDLWTVESATVTCRMLGFPGAISATRQAKFGEGSGEIWLDNVKCQGKEKTIYQCQHNKLGVHNCDHSEDAGVVCQTGFRSLFRTNVLTRYPVGTDQNESNRVTGQLP